MTTIEDVDTELTAMTDALATLSPDGIASFEAEARSCCDTWLYTYGVPSCPAELLTFARQLAGNIVAQALLDELVVLTDKGRATPEDQAKNKATYDAIVEATRQRLTGFRAMAAPPDEQEDVTETHPGGYL